jgi:hypothetical protein
MATEQASQFICSSELNLKIDRSCNVIAAAGFVNGLLSENVPVAVFHTTLDYFRTRAFAEFEKSCLRDLVEAATDRVFMSAFRAFYGLERAVVVNLPGPEMGEKMMTQDGRLDLIDPQTRFHGLSRCLSQLILVQLPSLEEIASNRPHLLTQYKQDMLHTQQTLEMVKDCHAGKISRNQMAQAIYLEGAHLGGSTDSRVREPTLQKHKHSNSNPPRSHGDQTSDRNSGLERNAQTVKDEPLNDSDRSSNIKEESTTRQVKPGNSTASQEKPVHNSDTSGVSWAKKGFLL